MRILIVEDEVVLANALADGLRRDGHVVTVAFDGCDVLAILEDNEVDVVILDRDIPGVHGDTLCRDMVQRRESARVLMLTASSSQDHIIGGLELGADDYMTKPFDYRELLARLQALGRRTRFAPEEEQWPTELLCGPLRMDCKRNLAEVNGRPLRLTPKEFAILRLLLSADGRFLTPERILDLAWEDPFERNPGLVRVCIHTLRRKLGNAVAIENRHGVGYRIVE